MILNRGVLEPLLRHVEWPELYNLRLVCRILYREITNHSVPIISVGNAVTCHPCIRKRRLQALLDASSIMSNEEITRPMRVIYEFASIFADSSIYSSRSTFSERIRAIRDLLGDPWVRYMFYAGLIEKYPHEKQTSVPLKRLKNK